jgi:hypothetical protein
MNTPTEPLQGQWKDYNTLRHQMEMPEYGRHIQKMVFSLLNIEDRQKRNEQAQSVIAVMGTLFPHLKNIEDFKHKLWDHLFIISEFKLDIDSPYPKPSPVTFATKPKIVPHFRSDDVRIRHYGRCVQEMIRYIVTLPDNEIRRKIVIALCNHMKRTYLFWNKDVVSDDIIFKDVHKLSGGMITIDANTRLVVGNYYTPEVAHTNTFNANRKQYPSSNGTGSNTNGNNRNNGAVGSNLNRNNPTSVNINRNNNSPVGVNNSRNSLNINIKHNSNPANSTMKKRVSSKEFITNRNG